MESPGEEPFTIDDSVDLYLRAWGFARAMPFVLAIPFAAEMLQHAIEIGLGMYIHGGALTDTDRATRLGFGALKSMTVLFVLLFALRWWRFEGDSLRAATPDLRLLRGLAISLLVELGGSSLFQFAGYLLARAGHVSVGSEAWIIATFVPILLWAMISVLLFPWYVGLLTGDNAIGCRRSVANVYPIWGGCFGIYVAGMLPLMALHYALGYGAMGFSGAIVWLPMIVDAGVVAMMAVVTASTYYAVYLRARA